MKNQRLLTAGLCGALLIGVATAAAAGDKPATASTAVARHVDHLHRQIDAQKAQTQKLRQQIETLKQQQQVDRQQLEQTNQTIERLHRQLKQLQQSGRSSP